MYELPNQHFAKNGSNLSNSHKPNNRVGPNKRVDREEAWNLINVYGCFMYYCQIQCTVTCGDRTVADYRRFTVKLREKTLLTCILLLTPAIKVHLREFTIEITGKSLATVQMTVIPIVDYLYFWGQIL